MIKLTKTIAAAAILSIGFVASASAHCDNYIAASASGFGNKVATETWGDHYVSVDQDGDLNRVRGRIQGRCNAYVTGQYGDGNRANAAVSGSFNGVAMLQNTDNVRARANVMGNDNAIFSSQSRWGSRASFDVAGGGNRIVNVQH
jgi:hypothetical protein